MPEVPVRHRNLSYVASPLPPEPDELNAVFVHGTGGDAQDWRGQSEGLAPTCGFIALDLPGHGGSHGPGERQVADYATWVIEFVNALSLTKVVLVGNSLGSAIVQWIALEPPDWLAGIVLVGAGARLRVHPKLLQGILEDREKALASLADLALSEQSEDDLRERVKAQYLAGSTEVIHGDLSACDGFDIMDRVADISVPAHIIVGQDDRLTPEKYGRFLNDRLQDSTMVVIPEAGHLVMREKPEEFNGFLRSFMERLRR